MYKVVSIVNVPYLAYFGLYGPKLVFAVQNCGFRGSLRYAVTVIYSRIRESEPKDRDEVEFGYGI